MTFVIVFPEYNCRAERKHTFIKIALSLTKLSSNPNTFKLFSEATTKFFKQPIEAKVKRTKTLNGIFGGDSDQGQ